MIDHFNLPREIIDQVDAFVRNIFTNGARGVRLLAVMSSVQEEGTSSVVIDTAVNLAVNNNSRILLIDANIRKPILHQIFNVEKENGLTDLILNGTRLETVIKKTTIPNLSLITCGRDEDNPNRLFDSFAIKQLFENQGKEFDCIILDCPPVNSCPETILLALQSDYSILVVHSGKTRREVVLNAQTQLINAGVKNAGIVLNRRKYYIPEVIYNLL